VPSARAPGIRVTPKNRSEFPAGRTSKRPVGSATSVGVRWIGAVTRGDKTTSKEIAHRVRRGFVPSAMALRAVRIAAAARAGCHAVVPRPLWLGSIVRYIAISSVAAAPGGGKKKSAAEPPPVDEAGGADVGAADDPASEGKDLKTALARHVEYARRELSQVRVATANPSECRTRLVHLRKLCQ